MVKCKILHGKYRTADKVFSAGDVVEISESMLARMKDVFVPVKEEVKEEEVKVAAPVVKQVAAPVVKPQAKK